MTTASLKDFRDSLRIVPLTTGEGAEKLYTYWNNKNLDSPKTASLDEVIHIVQRSDGSFCLQIANCITEGRLEDLEAKLYAWALDEGWLD